MNQLLGVPVPSPDQIIVGAELVFILLPVRILSRTLDNDVRKFRNYVINHHVKSGHADRLKQCEDGYCPSLRSSEPQLEAAQPEIELDLL